MCTYCFDMPILRTNRQTTYTYCYIKLYYEQSMQWLELSLNGTERATRGWRDCLVVFNVVRIIDNFVMSETKSVNANLVDFKTTNLLESRQIQSQHQVACSVKLHLYPLHGHRKKQTTVSQSRTEAEVGSLNTGLRMEGVLATTLWDIVVHVLERFVSQARRNTSRQLKPNRTEATEETLNVFHQTHQSPAIVLICFFFSRQ